MNYEQGLERLKQQAQGTAWYMDFALYEGRLRDNLERGRRYGTAPQLLAERFEIIDQLNRLSNDHTGVSFVDLCQDSNRASHPTPKADAPLPSDDRAIDRGPAVFTFRSDPPPSNVHIDIHTNLYISYSGQDKTYLDELHSHLEFYVRSGAVSYWDDTKVGPGAVRQQEMKKALWSAKKAILLVSAAYLASDAIAAHELPFLLAGARRGDLMLLNVIVRPCAFARSELNAFRSFNDPEQPVMAMSDSQREDLWHRLAETVASPLNLSL